MIALVSSDDRSDMKNSEYLRIYRKGAYRQVYKIMFCRRCTKIMYFYPPYSTLFN